MKKLQTLISAYRATRSPQTQNVISALLIDELEKAGASLPDIQHMMMPAEEHSIQLECETLIALHAAYVQTNQKPSVEHLIEELFDRVFTTQTGIPRLILLDRLWQTTPYKMKAYGLLRACYLGAEIKDLEAAYGMEGIPSDTLPAWIALAQIALRGGEISQAYEISSAIAAQVPDSPFISEILGNTLLAMARHTEADQCYRQIEKNFAWPAAYIHLSDETLQQYFNSTYWDTPATQYQWLNATSANRPTQVFVVSVDDLYARRYLPRLIETLKETQVTEEWLLHAHLINPSQETLAWIAQLQAHGEQIAATCEAIAPPPSATTDTHKVVEARTYYACARLCALPLLLAQYQCPTWVIDVDMEALRSTSALKTQFRINPETTDLAIVPMAERGRCLYEYIWLSLSYFTPSEKTIRYTKLLSRYINHQLKLGHWGWGLDQAAFYATLQWYQRFEPTLEVVQLPSQIVEDQEFASANAYFRSHVGSRQ